MNHERHGEITRLAFGYEGILIHRWLDATFGKWANSKKSPFNHWLLRHHVEAIDKEYSDLTTRGVAYLHVVSDISSRWREYVLPANEQEMRDYLTLKGVKLEHAKPVL